MTIGGWIIMIFSVSFVTILFFWSLYLVLTHKKAIEHLHSTLDETPDIKEDT
ncbi:MAG: hypothetical protein NZ853_09740 [Leptospiraceae bacterium]|nr:hypothetical protein [Leptospiraceae bacterium]MDW7976977.1 hypothetical protein [Leptospiraceae bacterium]